MSAMKHRVSEYVSFRDVPLAIIYSVVWFVVLWAVGYPTDERVGVAVIAYVALWTSRMIVNALVLFALRQLHSLALRKADELDVPIPEEPSPSITTIARAAAVALLLAMFLVILGMSLTATVPIVVLIGLPLLPVGFGAVGGIAFGAGALALSIIFGVPFILFKWPERVAVFARLNSRSPKNFAWS